MDLFLVQHGEARPEVEDPERSLTDRGEETVRKVAAWAARAGLRVDQIRHSGKRRAEQTAAILADSLRPIQGMVAMTGLAPNDDVKPVAEAIRTEPKSVMLVGHLSFLSRLLSLLVAGNAEAEIVRFQQGGIVCLSSQEGKWSVNWAVPPDRLS